MTSIKPKLEAIVRGLGELYSLNYSVGLEEPAIENITKKLLKVGAEQICARDLALAIVQKGERSPICGMGSFVKEHALFYTSP